jgi:hypothetical protein
MTPDISPKEEKLVVLIEGAVAGVDLHSLKKPQ